ncbi:MAG: chemotaxis protein CheA [Thermodesulfobacteriota bacterium]
MENRELIEIYFTEADDLLQRIEKGLLALEDNPDEPGCIQEVFRAVHTMKSSAAMVGFDTISEYAHLVENLLDRLRSGRLQPSRPLISQFLTGQSLLKTMVEKASRGEEPLSPVELQAQKEQLGRFMGLEGLEEPSPLLPALSPSENRQDHYYQIHLAFKEDLFFSGQDPLMLIRELQDLGEIIQIKTDHTRVPRLPDIDPFVLYLTWKILLKSRQSLSTIEEVFCFVRDEHPLKIQDVTGRFPEGVDPGLAEKRIGDLLLEEGIINPQDLQEAILEQKKIGQVLVEKGKVSENTLSRLMAEQEKSRTQFRKSTIRVDTHKLDELANFVEELSVNLSRVSHELEKNAQSSYRMVMEEMDRVEQNLREIREQVMRVRMFPLEGTFQRLQRMARDLAAQEGKDLNIEIHGAETELDKDLIEQITDPLKHCIRNAVDHGLEPPEERQKKGKSPKGLLTLEAFQREGKIFVRISDDGRGLDLDAIFKKAVENRLLSPEAQPTAAELQRLILLPGFSTSREVSDLSGRGVGLDVVQDQISRLGGLVEIFSSPGRGTTFSMSIPLTLAVMEGLRIDVGGESYLVPVSSVLTVRTVEEQDLKTIEAREEMLRFEEKYIPAVRLEAILGAPGREDNSHKIALILDSHKRRFALLADQILETKQVVIKGLEANFRSIPGVAGGAILGDGSVCLILDIYGLDRLIFGGTLGGNGRTNGSLP